MLMGWMDRDSPPDWVRATPIFMRSYFFEGRLMILTVFMLWAATLLSDCRL
jgi:hypothetical protein